MAIRGQRFELDLDADDFTVKPVTDSEPVASHPLTIVKEIQEHDDDSHGIPAPPGPLKSSRSGFPEHKPRLNVSTFKQRQKPGEHVPTTATFKQRQKPGEHVPTMATFKQRQKPGEHVPTTISTTVEPSDRAIAQHLGMKYGVDLQASRDRAEISEENTRRIAAMSVEDIEQARAELMGNLSPAFIQRLLRRANIDEDQQSQPGWPGDTAEASEGGAHDDEDQDNHPRGASDTAEASEGGAHDDEDQDNHPRGPSDTAEAIEGRWPSSPSDRSTKKHAEDTEIRPRAGEGQPPAPPSAPSIHFPVPPRSADDFVPLDPNSPSFLAELKQHYFPDTPHDPSSLAWLQDPTSEEDEDSPYHPEKDSYTPSSLRFGFTGRLIPPHESLNIDVSEGLHHHGEAPRSAGYTIPELAILARSTLPNQRCMAYQTLGRLLYRLGRGDFGPRGSELQEGLWSVIEKERPIEVMMSESNRPGGHMSAKAYATEALWLWRKGGGGDRGVLRAGEQLAK